MMKKTVFALFVALIVLTSACNQGSKNKSNEEQVPASPEAVEMADRQMERLTESLDLSTDQQEKIREIIAMNFEDMQKMREEMRDGNGDRDAMREQMMKAREEQNEKMQKVLSEEQWVKYEEIMKEMRGRRGEGRRGGEGRNE